LVAITAAYQTDWSEVAVPSRERQINPDFLLRQGSCVGSNVLLAEMPNSQDNSDPLLRTAGPASA
jgi:hypothetical protein